MRLRKTFKQTAAAALALSMTVSSTTPAMATYYCDLNQGDVTIIVSDAGEKTITVGETEIKNTGDGDDIIIYDGRNENSYPKENSDGPNAPSPAAETNESSESDEDGFSDSEIIESSEIGSNKSVDEESSDKIEDEPTQSSAKSISSDTIREKQADDSAIESESHDISDSAEDTPTENKALSALQEDCKTDSEPVEQDAESVKVETTSEDTNASLPSLKTLSRSSTTGQKRHSTSLWIISKSMSATLAVLTRITICVTPEKMLFLSREPATPPSNWMETMN